MSAAAGQKTLSRGERLWAEEISGLLGATTSLAPAARTAVIAVVESLADDATESPETRRDARALLASLHTGQVLEAARPNANAPTQRREEAVPLGRAHLLTRRLASAA